MNKYLKTMIFALLALGFAACSNNDDIDLEVENSNIYVEFRSELRAYAGSDDESEEFNQFYLYGMNAATGVGLLNNYVTTKVLAKRNVDDPTMWDYKATSTKNGGNGLWQWISFKNPVSFWGVGGDTEALKQYAINPLKKRASLKVQLALDHYDATTRVAHYNSEDIHDLLFGCALNCSGSQYVADTSMVYMPFLHILPRLNVRASLGSDALEVTVHKTTIIGLCMAAEYHFCDAQPTWVPFTAANTTDGAVTEILMNCSSPVKLQPSLLPLCDKGKEARVIPQTVKPWTSSVAKDGMGIRLSVQVRSKANGEYLVGSASAPADIFMPLQAMTLTSGMHYNIDITFSSLYDANGNPNGYQLSYQPTVNPWVEDTDNLIGQ